MVDRYRTVVEGERYRNERKALSKDIRRWDEMIAGLLGAADVVLYYMFDAEEVTLLSVRQTGELDRPPF